MSHFRIRLGLAHLAISAIALALAANAAEPVLPLDVQQRLEVLKTGFESYVLKSVTIPYNEGVKALNAKVKPALERESAIAAKRKDLEALVRIKSDIERTDKGLLLTEADSAPPEALKNLYAAYKLEMAKIESVKKISLAEAKQRYDKGLALIQDELTAAQKVEGALHVKQLREDVANTSADATATGLASLPVLKDGAFINSLGMKFVPVEHEGKTIITSIWSTRYEDYAAYAKDEKRVDNTWAGGAAGAPVIQINWQEAVDFCEWLTRKEHKAGMIGPKQKYRLLTGEEWAASKAVFDSRVQPAWEWCMEKNPKGAGLRVIKGKASKENENGATETGRYPDVSFRILLEGR